MGVLQSLAQNDYSLFEEVLFLELLGKRWEGPEKTINEDVVFRLTALGSLEILEGPFSSSRTSRCFWTSTLGGRIVIGIMIWDAAGP